MSIFVCETAAVVTRTHTPICISYREWAVSPSHRCNRPASKAVDALLVRGPPRPELLGQFHYITIVH